MKKIILVLIIFLCSACYDYNEINSLAIINGIGLDYQENQYILTYEIIDTKKSGSEEQQMSKSYTVTSSAKTLEETITKQNNKIPNKISFENIDVMVISKNIANLGLLNFADYFLRDNNLTTNFYVVMSEISPQKLLSFQDQEKNINTETIKKLLTNSNSNISYSTKDQFDYLIANIKDNYEDLVIPDLNIDDNIYIDNLAVFKKDKFKYFISKDEINTYSILKKTLNSDLIIKNNIESIKIYNKKINMDYQDNEYQINIDLMGKIENIEDNLNIKDTSTI